MSTDPRECISFGIIDIDAEEILLLNFSEMTAWLADPTNENKVTCNNPKLLDPENHLDTILNVQGEYSYANRGLPPGIDDLNNSSVANYAKKYFANPQTKNYRPLENFAAWCEGTNLGTMFVESYATGLEIDEWDTMLGKIAKISPDLDYLQLAPLKATFRKERSEIVTPAMEKLTELFQRKKNEKPKEKIINTAIIREALKICDLARGESHSFFTILNAGGFYPNTSKDQKRALEQINTCY